jgi:hypothetical protein
MGGVNHAKKLSRKGEVRGAADGKKFGKTLYNAEQDRVENIQGNSLLILFKPGLSQKRTGKCNGITNEKQTRTRVMSSATILSSVRRAAIAFHRLLARCRGDIGLIVICEAVAVLFD